jgi:hypothetical protein
MIFSDVDDMTSRVNRGDVNYFLGDDKKESLGNPKA